MTPNERDQDIERLGRRARPQEGVEEAWARLYASTVAEDVQREARDSAVAAVPSVSDTQTHKIFSGRMSRTRSLRYRAWYALVGAVVGAIAVMVGMRLRATHPRPLQANQMVTYVTENRQRANIQLPDGSSVALGVASRLDVPVDYRSGNHTVRLRGEAVFTVRHHDDNPLIVRAGSTMTRVLGTSFLVRHYETDSMTTIAVRAGKVAVHESAIQPIVLTAAQQAKVSPSGSVRIDPLDPTQFSFTRGLLVLKSVPLPDAIVELDRWYNTDIRLNDPSLATQRVTGEFTADSLSNLAEILELMFKVRVAQHGRVLTLFPR